MVVVFFYFPAFSWLTTAKQFNGGYSYFRGWLYGYKVIWRWLAAGGGGYTPQTVSATVSVLCSPVTTVIRRPNYITE